MGGRTCASCGAFLANREWCTVYGMKTAAHMSACEVFSERNSDHHISSTPRLWRYQGLPSTFSPNERNARMTAIMNPATGEIFFCKPRRIETMSECPLCIEAPNPDFCLFCGLQCSCGPLIRAMNGGR